MDGPAGTGKSTVSRRLAHAGGAAYLDTGAMYRAVTLAVLRAGWPPTDPEADVVAVARAVRLQSGTDPATPRIELDGEDVEAEIRGAAGDPRRQRRVRGPRGAARCWWSGSAT